MGRTALPEGVFRAVGLTKRRWPWDTVFYVTWVLVFAVAVRLDQPGIIIGFFAVLVLGGHLLAFGLWMFKRARRNGKEDILDPQPERAASRRDELLEELGWHLDPKWRGIRIVTSRDGDAPFLSSKAIELPASVRENWSTGAIVWWLKSQRVRHDAFDRSQWLLTVMVLALFVLMLSVGFRFGHDRAFYLLLPGVLILALSAAVVQTRAQLVREPQLTVSENERLSAREALSHVWLACRKNPWSIDAVVAACVIRYRAVRLGFDLPATAMESVQRSP